MRDPQTLKCIDGAGSGARARSDQLDLCRPVPSSDLSGSGMPGCALAIDPPAALRHLVLMGVCTRQILPGDVAAEPSLFDGEGCTQVFSLDAVVGWFVAAAGTGVRRGNQSHPVHPLDGAECPAAAGCFASASNTSHGAFTCLSGSSD